ncbi:hypothetical protein [Providencia phage PSTCR6]|nr:hypothetical protein [Providencia phage PSTCR6]
MYIIEFLIGNKWYRMEQNFELPEAKEIAKKLSDAKGREHGFYGTLVLDSKLYASTYEWFIGKDFIKSVRLSEVKKPLTINKNSWHYKLFHLLWYKNPKTYCGYFWKGLLTLLLILGLLITVIGFVTFLGIEILSILGIVLDGAILKGFTGFLVGTASVSASAGVVFLVGFIITLITKGITVLAEYWETKKLDKELQEFDIQVEHDDKPEIKIYKSFKNKHCALIKYE